MFNAHVIEYRAKAMMKAIVAVWEAGGPNQPAAVAAIEAAAGYRHGWFFDAMAGASFQNNGGENVVWSNQPVMD